MAFRTACTEEIVGQCADLALAVGVKIKERTGFFVDGSRLVQLLFTGDNDEERDKE